MMRKGINLIIALLIFILLPQFLRAENKFDPDKPLADNVPSMRYMLNNANMGKDFWIAIPQHDNQTSQPERVLDIYIISFTDTKIRFQVPSLLIDRVRDVKAFEPLVLSSTKGETSFSWECRTSQTPEGKGIHITSDAPIAIFVLSARLSTADGFLAIPTVAWGKKYVHCAFYDHSDASIRNRGGGFVVVAREKNTNITIQLKGVGGNDPDGATDKGNKIGETLSAKLDEGQIYMVKSSGRASGIFDLSGTIITSTKPIGVISYHERTMVPNDCNNGRDFLAEMLIPTQNWGKTYATQEFNRTSKHYGDFFRVVACENNTHWECDYYDMSTKNKIGRKEGYLNEGEFWEFNKTRVRDNNTQTSIMGYSYWKADKPIMLMQYSYSFPWDGNTTWDPLMILVPPIDQYVTSAIFQTPISAGFKNNDLTIFAIGNPNDPNQTLLKSITFDGAPLYINNPLLFSNRLPETNIYYLRIALPEGVHRIETNTKFSGFVTGNSGYGPYGWPLSMGTRKIDEYDTLKPTINLVNTNCGSFTFEATDRYTATINDNPRQIDQGLQNIFCVPELTDNYLLTLKRPEYFDPTQQMTEQTFYLNPIDTKNDAKAVYVVIDRAGNYTIDSVIYKPDLLSFDKEILDYGKVRVNKIKELKFEITNPDNTFPVTINQIYLKNATKFNIFGTLPPLPQNVQPGETKTVTISYSPIEESILDVDSLFFITTCNMFKTPLTGTAVMPKISVEDWNADSLIIEKKICMETQNGYGLRIVNPGSDTLLISSFENVEPPFSISNPTEPPLPIILAPNEEIYLKSVCFAPIDTGEFTTNIIAISDAMSGDSIAVLEGIGVPKPINVKEDTKLSDNLVFHAIPNPVFSDKTTIFYKIDSPSNTQLLLYDICGRKLMSLLNEYKDIGSYQIDLLTSQVQPGIYLIKLISGNSIENLKLIITK